MKNSRVRERWNGVQESKKIQVKVKKKGEWDLFKRDREWKEWFKGEESIKKMWGKNKEGV